MLVAQQCNLVQQIVWQHLTEQEQEFKNKALHRFVSSGVWEECKVTLTKGNHGVVDWLENWWKRTNLKQKNLALSVNAPLFWAKHGVGTGLGEGKVYSSRHFLFLFFTGGGHRTARIASSNTVLRPRCVSAEHSRYFTAPVEGKQAVTEQFSVPAALLLAKATTEARRLVWLRCNTFPDLDQRQPHCHHTNLFCHGKALWVGDRSQFLLLQLLDSVLVIPEVEFGTH